MSSRHSHNINVQRDQRKQDDRVRQFTVSDVGKHPKGGHTVYKIVLLESPIELSLPPVERTVWKRYRDIRKLYDSLVQLHASLFLPGKVPDFPKAKLFGRFDETTVEERRRATEDFLQFFAVFPIVCRNSLVQSFFSRSEFPADVRQEDVPKSIQDARAECITGDDLLVVSNGTSVADESAEEVKGSDSAALARDIEPWWVNTDTGGSGTALTGTTAGSDGDNTTDDNSDNLSNTMITDDPVADMCTPARSPEIT